jgi:hypothetical protein
MFYDPFQLSAADHTRSTPSCAFQQAFRTFNEGESAMATKKVEINRKRKARRCRRFTASPQSSKRMKNEDSISAAPSSHDSPVTDSGASGDTKEVIEKEYTGDAESDLSHLFNLQFDDDNEGKLDSFYNMMEGAEEEGGNAAELDVEVDFYAPLPPLHEELLLDDE